MPTPEKKPAIGLYRGLNLVAETLRSIPDTDTFKRIISHPRSRRGIQLLGVFAIAGASVLTSIPTFEHNSVQAEGDPSKAPITLQGVDNPYYFTYKGNIRRWSYDQNWGIPPNNSGRLIGTIWDYFNNNTTSNFKIQPQESKYPETQLGYGVSLPIGAVGVDPEAGCGGMLTATSGSEGNRWAPYYESIRSLDNPIDYSDGARSVTSAGLPQQGWYGDLPLEFIIGKDNSGNFVRIYIGHTYNPAEAGWYKAQRDPNSCVVSGSFVKEDPRPYKLYLPSIVQN